MQHINKLFLSTLGLGLLVGYTAHAQLGVNLGGAAPQTSLDVNGAITTRPVSVAVSSNAAAVPANAGQVILTGSATADIVLTTATPYAGQLLTLVNNTTGGQRALLNGIPVNNGQALLFVGDAASSNFKSADNGFAASAATTYWNLQGNSGTSPATNFLGTIDAQDQAFRTSDIERMRILAGGNVGLNTTAPKSTLEVNGSFGANYLSVTAATYTLLTTDFYVDFKGTAAGTLTLPSGLNAKGRLYTVKNGTSAQALTLTTTSSETIDGSTSLSIPAGQSVQVVTTGATSGVATYEIVDFSAASSAGAGAGVTASNGLTATNGNVKLGGTLTANTEVATGTTNGTNNFILTGKGFLGLGMVSGATPTSKFHVVTDASTGGTEDDYIFDDYASSAANLSNHLLLRSSRGTVAAPTPSVNGDQLGGITFAPRTGTGTGSLTFGGSELYGFYKGDGTTGLTDLRFNTSSTERMRLDETGRLGLGTTTPQSTLEVNGSVAGNYRSITATGTTALTATDFVVVYNGTAAGTFTLPSGLNAKGRLYTVKNTTTAQTLTLTTTSSETIDGSTSLSIPAGQSVQVVTTGATSGVATYEIVDFSAASSAGAGAGVTASNGLTATSGNVKLGGTLTAATDVATAGFGLTFSGAGKFAFGTTTTNGLFNVSGAMGSTSFTSGLNLTNTTGLTTGNTLSITPGYAGANTGLTTGTLATYDLPGAGNHIFGDNVIPDGNLNNLGSAANRWAYIYGANANFTGSLTANASSPSASLTANATDYFVVTQSAITYTLPAATANVGRTLIIYAFGGATTIASAGGGIFGPATFSGSSATTYALAQYHRITFICDGSNWISIAYL
ncbi:MAG: beta strand repeat-containing protein [Janthinobacterium lividum]